MRKSDVQVKYEYILKYVENNELDYDQSIGAKEFLRIFFKHDMAKLEKMGTDSNEIKDTLIKYLKKRIKFAKQDDDRILQDKYEEFCAAFPLSNFEKEFLKIMFICSMGGVLYNFIRQIEEHSRKPFEVLSNLLNVAPHDIYKAVAQGSLIHKLQLLDLRRPAHSSYNESVLEVSYDFKDWIHGEQSTLSLEEYAAGKSCDAKLKTKDFDYIQDELDLMCSIMKGAIDNQAKGINILLYGPPGTGKTEIAKVIAKKLNTKIYSIAESGDKNDEIDNKYRLRKLIMADMILGAKSQSLILFDEMEDLERASVHNGSALSKVFLNRTLENNQAPTIWTTNSLNCFDPALLRRMTYICEMQAPPKAARTNIVNNLVKSNKVDIDTDLARGVAQKYDMASSYFDTAVKVVKLTNNATHLNKVMASHYKTQTGKEFTEQKALTNYNLNLINSKDNLYYLQRALLKSGKTEFSMCLYGPSGTGKSAFLRHLAECLELEVLQYRASDLLGAYVGETEKRIAEAFQKAKNERALLIFDEADSFLQSREKVRYSWKVSAVNEMLTWMERHEYPFACTTNLMDVIDKASLRRFTFKAAFDFMNEEQTQMAFNHFFPKAELPRNFEKMRFLTPGDFALVQKKVMIFDEGKNTPLICKLLREEIGHKNMDISAKSHLITI